MLDSNCSECAEGSSVDLDAARRTASALSGVCLRFDGTHPIICVNSEEPDADAKLAGAVAASGALILALIAEVEALRHAMPGPGVERIAAERQRQVSQEGWTPQHDLEHTAGELSVVQARLRGLVRVTGDGVYVRRSWPWDLEEPDRVRRLEAAGALIAAELDRMLSGTSDAPG